MSPRVNDVDPTDQAEYVQGSGVTQTESAEDTPN